MDKLVWLLCCFLLPFSAPGQVKVKPGSDKVNLTNNNQVWALYAQAEEPFSDIVQKNFKSPYDSSFVPKPKKAVWLKFQILNTDRLTDNCYVYSREAFYTVYLQSDSGWQTYRNGYLLPLAKRDYKKNTFFIPLKVKPNEPRWVYIKLLSGNYRPSRSFPKLCNQLAYYETLNEELEYNQPGTTFTLIYLSGLTMIAFFTLILFLSTRKPMYGYYLLYLLFQVLYSLLIFARTPLKFLNIALYFPKVGYTVVEGVQFLFVGFYVLFILKLLEIKKHSRRLSRVMHWLARLCFAYAVLSMGYTSLFPDPNTISWVFTISRLIILPVNLLLIFWIIAKVRHPLIWYFIAANFFFFAGSVLSVYVSFSGLSLDPNSIFYFGNSLNTLFQMGLLGEVLCFSFAIAHHVHLLQLEKESHSAAYIHQLQENQRIQENMNKELDKKINEKTNELIQLYSDIEKQREKEIKLEFSQKIKEMEMLALRAQMNPHFLFNSMNSIKHLIHTGRQKDAMDYLDDFSGLLRGVLQNSKRETITVEDELEILELYLSLEKGRLGKELNYTISVDDKEALSQYPIPALLLQPFVENAIWHGLMPSRRKDKSLNISLSVREGLTITIQDNGIGRKKALRATSTNLGTRKSFGIRITQERLALFNHLHDQKITLQVADWEKGIEETGTLVTFTYSNKSS